MSLGIGAHANIVLENEHTVIYEYGGYNLNDPKFRNENRVYDGKIVISKECFVELEIHEKLKRMPSGRKKLITKRSPVSVDFRKMLEEGFIKIENCSNCWRTTEDDLHIDVMVCHLLFYIFLRYQEEGKIPEVMNYNI